MRLASKGCRSISQQILCNEIYCYWVIDLSTRVIFIKIHYKLFPSCFNGFMVIFNTIYCIRCTSKII